MLGLKSIHASKRSSRCFVRAFCRMVFLYTSKNTPYNETIQLYGCISITCDHHVQTDCCYWTITHRLDSNIMKCQNVFWHFSLLLYLYISSSGVSQYSYSRAFLSILITDILQEIFAFQIQNLKAKSQLNQLILKFLSKLSSRFQDKVISMFATDIASFKIWRV